MIALYYALPDLRKHMLISHLNWIRYALVLTVCACVSTTKTEGKTRNRSGLQNNAEPALLVALVFSILKEQIVHLKSHKINFKIFL